MIDFLVADVFLLNVTNVFKVFFFLFEYSSIYYFFINIFKRTRNSVYIILLLIKTDRENRTVGSAFKIGIELLPRSMAITLCKSCTSHNTYFLYVYGHQVAAHHIANQIIGSLWNVYESTLKWIFVNKVVSAVKRFMFH